jgi:adenosylcobinamide amidohydrolase
MLALLAYLLATTLAMATGTVIGCVLIRAFDRKGRCNWCGRGEK